MWIFVLFVYNVDVCLYVYCCLCYIVCVSIWLFVYWIYITTCLYVGCTELTSTTVKFVGYVSILELYYVSIPNDGSSRKLAGGKISTARHNKQQVVCVCYNKHLVKWLNLNSTVYQHSVSSPLTFSQIFCHIFHEIMLLEWNFDKT